MWLNYSLRGSDGKEGGDTKGEGGRRGRNRKELEAGCNLVFYYFSNCPLTYSAVQSLIA